MMEYFLSGVVNVLKSLSTNTILIFLHQNSETQSYENILQYIAIMLSSIGTARIN